MGRLDFYDWIVSLGILTRPLDRSYADQMIHVESGMKLPHENNVVVLE